MKAIIDLTLSTFVANLGADQKDRALWGQAGSMKTSRHLSGVSKLKIAISMRESWLRVTPQV